MASGRPTRFTALVAGAERRVELLPLGDGRWQIAVDDRVCVVDGRPTGAGSWSLLIDGRSVELSLAGRDDDWRVSLHGHPVTVRLLDERAARRRPRGATAGDRELRAVMPGKVVAVLVAPGTAVQQGQGVLVLEAMKMENEVGAPRAGTVRDIRVQPGQAVEAGELLAVIE